MEPERSEAVVIAVKDYGESDKIVTFFSLDRGRMSGIAKGAKRSLKRFVNKLELFTRLEIHFTDSRSSSLVRLDQADLLDHFPLLRSDYARYTGAILLCELVLAWTQEADPDANLFQLLKWGLSNLADPQRSLLWVVVIFQLKLFTLLGYQPQLDGCSNCGQLSPARAPFRFRPALSGLSCAHCARSPHLADTPLGLNVSLSTIKLLQKAQELDASKLSRLRFSPREEREAALLLRAYGDNILQREILAWEQLLEQAAGK
ncbi:MAG: DNA repair protein RecO [Desulfobulbaceae bacterium]|nr:DNA repair protein RecO [Desulfobulbaceae bacterium]